MLNSILIFIITRKRWLLLSWMMALFTTVGGQPTAFTANTAYQPIIRSFFSNEGYHQHNTKVIADKHGKIWLAHRHGIVVFDGKHWAVIDRHKSNSAKTQVFHSGGNQVTAVAYDSIQEVIYLGLRSGEIARVQTQGINLKFEILPGSTATDVAIEKIEISSDRRVYFKRNQQTLIWDEKKLTMDNRFEGGWACLEGKIYPLTTQGLETPQGKSSLLLANRDTIVSTAAAADGTHLIVTHNGRLLKWTTGSGISELKIIPNNPAITVRPVAAGLIANQLWIATAELGCRIYQWRNDTAELVRRFDADNGLTNQRLHDLHIDQRKQVWITHEQGVQCIFTDYPLQDLSFNPGLRGTLYAIARMDGQLYAGSSRGLFILAPCKPAVALAGRIKNQLDPLNSTSWCWQPVKGLDAAVYQLIRLNDRQLLILTDEGIYSLQNGTVQQVAAVENALQLLPLSTQHIVVTMTDGVGLLTINGNLSNFKLALQGSQYRCQGAYQVSANKVLLLFQNGQVAIYQKEGDELNHYTLLTLPRGEIIRGAIAFTEKTVLFGRQKNYTLLPEEGRMVADTLYTDILPGNAELYFYQQPQTQNWYYTYENNIYQITEQGYFSKGGWNLRLPVKSIAIDTVNKDLFIFGVTDNQAVSVSIAKLTAFLDKRKETLSAYIARIRYLEKVHFYLPQPIEDHLEEGAKIELSVSSPFYENTDAIRYRYRLYRSNTIGGKKLYQAAEDWQEQAEFSFQGLDAGSYELHIDVQDGFGIQTPTLIYKFDIQWPTRQWIIFILLIAGTVGIVIWGTFWYSNLRMRRITLERNRFRDAVEEKTQEIEEKRLILEKKTHDLSRTIRTLEEVNSKLLTAQDEILAAHQQIEQQYAGLRTLSHIGRDIMGMVDRSHIIRDVYQAVNTLLPAPVLGIATYRPFEETLDYYVIENGRELVGNRVSLAETRRPGVICFQRQEDIMINDFRLTTQGLITQAVIGKMPAAMIYLPLTHKETRIGVLTVQSFKPNVYTDNHLNILRTLAGFVAGALATADAYDVIQKQRNDLQNYSKNLETINLQLKESTYQIEQQNKELIARQEQILQQQHQLLAAEKAAAQADKLATLGQLVAGVAHEINTPLGVIKGASEDLQQALSRALRELPEMLRQLSPEEEALFFKLVEGPNPPRPPVTLTSKEQRQLRRKIENRLIEMQVTEAQYIAEELVKIGVEEDLTPYAPILKHPQAEYLIAQAAGLCWVQADLQNILTAVSRTQKIVFALRNYARHGGSETPTPTDIVQNIETVLTLYHNQMKHSVEVIRNYAPDLPLIPAFADELNQVWTNIIHNALQAMENRGKLSIAISEAIHKETIPGITVTITDTGPGIPPEILPKIFDAFFTTKREGEGTGLGLMICRKIIQKHQGDIWVTGQPGMTTFHIWLPIETQTQITPKVN